MASKAAPEQRGITIDITPSAEAGEALTLRQQAGALVVIDRDSHANALEFIRGAKQLQRKIEEHWSRITRSVDDLKKNLLTLKRQDLAPVEDAIKSATAVALSYETIERERVRVEEERVRREAEATARVKREKEQRELEQAALKAEAGSKDLSEREQTFVDFYVRGSSAEKAAGLAGYKDPAGQATRLLATPKIVKAIAATRTAAEIRTQAAAKREAPLDVAPTQKVESQLGKAAGVRTTTNYSAAVDDLTKFRALYMAGKLPIEAAIPDPVYLNGQAVALKDTFEAAFPGCRLVKKTGIAG